MADGTAVLVFARAPIPGRVKTRLMPGLSAVQAAGLYRRMLERATASAVASRLGPVILCCDPDECCPYLQDLARRCGAALARQEGRDLGARMAHALETALDRHPRVLLMGSDCPSLDAGRLRDADAALGTGATVVFVPAVDGGYVLVGCDAPCREAFLDVPWGSARVMATTRQRLRAAGHIWRELPPLRDVDRVQDLDLLPRGF